MNYRECYEKGKATLRQAGVPEAELDARLLLEYVCGTDRNTLLVHGDREVTGKEQSVYEKLLERRRERVPLQHLTGVQNFMGLDFQINEHVLIPRQDTEILVEEVLKNLHDGMRILDMCTGSGCILTSILHYSNGCSGIGVDISAEALAVAEKNALQLLCGQREAIAGGGSDGRSKEQIQFVQSDLFEKVSGKFEIIVSNPPYIERQMISELMPEVREHEPFSALDGGTDGLDFYRRIISQSPSYLCGGGMLFFEIGYNQGEMVKQLMIQTGFKEVLIKQDYAGLDRVIYGTWF
ncbi:MAG: peptide chain release factor N(5)-glutamine methyltransferase [Lachnospiraceae bacterium]|nr:peptide chain release factor N(5)-glutamine methyltransferase [Lachnospiraceae bacterium]